MAGDLASPRCVKSRDRPAAVGCRRRVSRFFFRAPENFRYSGANGTKAGIVIDQSVDGRNFEFLDADAFFEAAVFK
jgi:hypothetical protein